jgi:outer membrane protein OmpA-like peptidoglycan-associated protein
MHNKPLLHWIAAAVALIALSGSAPAQTMNVKPTVPSTDEIVQRLTTPPSALPPSSVPMNMRGITIVKPPKGSQPKDRPNIDLAVNFEFNSARLTPDGELILDNLGKALQNPQLGSSRFSIGGHTDGVGTESYNKTLSEQRAETVRRYLIEHYGVTGDRLTAQGFGYTQLLDPANPKSAVNRRVEITNIGKAP